MKLPRFGLTTRIFASSAGIVVVVLAIALVVTQRSAQRAADASLRIGLQNTVDRVLEIVSADQGALAGRLRGYADNPEYRADIEKPDFNALDYTQTAVEQTGADWVQMTTREGIRQAKSDDPTAPPDDLTRSKLVRDALDGKVAMGFGVAGDSALIEIVSVPVEGAGGRILGSLMAAKFLTDSAVRGVASQTNSDVLFYITDTLGAPRLVAASERARRDSSALLATLSQPAAADSAQVALAGGADSAAAPRADSVAPDSAIAATQHVELSGETYVTRRGVISSASGTPIGGYLALRSLDNELRATGFTELQRTLFIAGGVGVLVAMLIAFFTARQVARPVRQLAAATRRAAEGDYQAEIPEGGSDEIGTLASAFRRLLADLKDKQALVDFLSSAAPGGTRMQTMLSPANAAVAAENASTLKIPTGAAGVNVLSPGQTFGNRYEIKSVLGVGGMGMVYKANDKELGEVLAIKTLKPDMIASDSNALERFKSEIKLARRIAHRNVVRTYDLGEISGQYYITMEYVEGKSLKDLIKERGRLPASVVLPIAKQLCRALEVSHDEGVIHRDIKPQNMVVQGDGVLKVMDFGIARLTTRPKESGHTEAGMVVGTPEYMAPEQLMGDELDARADLYATGVVLYECLVGTVPHTANTPIQLIAKVLEETPRAPREVKPDIPQAFSDLVMWVLAKDRDKRPRSAAELHSRLDAIVLS
jgi:HAMP domain-containing protein/predicted Ser/Thr protein kinase